MKPSQSSRELVTTMYNAKWDLMAHSQWRTKELLVFRKPPPFDTTANVLVAQRGAEEAVAEGLWKRWGEGGVGDGEYESSCAGRRGGDEIRDCDEVGGRESYGDVRVDSAGC
ncbi:hypothetical protein K432DRAFT_387520 [Lepidopterella palustris CBS 459.81]|uniref:Uncharacterized protein n=1 Tax=Lepidopterella palustris CBS 459.81 TaxID=1314670 RepID=A0A8E2DWT2_9PEZI|nr:hypothetical protein K432DRAFT_387520 [Lepidopterella palustris CBS 459.81]